MANGWAVIVAASVWVAIGGMRVSVEMEAGSGVEDGEARVAVPEGLGVAPPHPASRSMIKIPAAGLYEILNLIIFSPPIVPGSGWSDACGNQELGSIKPNPGEKAALRSIAPSNLSAGVA
jgi:hypothetical protein